MQDVQKNIAIDDCYCTLYPVVKEVQCYGN